MYELTKEQLAVNVASDKNGIVEICPEGVVSGDGYRLMIIPHTNSYTDGESYFLNKEQAEHVAANFFKTTNDEESIARVEKVSDYIRFVMQSDNLAINKLITCTEQCDGTVEWRKKIKEAQNEHKMYFVLDVLIDTLQKLKKVVNEKGMLVALEFGDNRITRFYLPEYLISPSVYMLYADEKTKNKNNSIME